MGSECIVDENSVFPKSEHDITEEWIKHVVGIAPLPKSISVTGNIQAGFGFLSNLCRVSFQSEDGEQKNILVKLLPVSPEYKALTLGENFDEREIRFYSIVLPKILEVVPGIGNNLCKVFCGKTSKRCNTDDDYASMLVMEDLKPLGYQMLNPESDKWSLNLEQVINFLAKFHCAGFALEKSTNKKISDLFPFCMGAGEWQPGGMLMELAKANITRLEPFLQKYNVSPEVLAAYKELVEQVEEYFLLALQETSKFPCLIHGDIWPPNIMVVEDDNDNSPAKIIDWQLLGVRDPTVELTVTILTCLPKAQVTKQNVDHFCKIYLDTCESLGTDIGRSRGEFQKCFDTWGMVYAYYWCLLSMDSFPDDMERLFLAFEFIQKEYKITEFLKK